MSKLEFWIIFAVAIIVHELGHYTFSRAFGVRVKRVSLFFNIFFTFLKYDPLTKRLDIFSRKKLMGVESEGGGSTITEASRCLLSIQLAKTDYPAFVQAESGRLEPAKKIEIDSIIFGGNQATQYCIGWLPFGGYIVPEYVGPFGVFSKGKYQQLLINLGGILFNFITLLLFMSVAVQPHIYDAVVGAEGSAPVYFKELEFFCVISVSLVALNILPLPGLDGYNSLMCVLNREGSSSGRVKNIVQNILGLVVFAFIISSWFGTNKIWEWFYKFVFIIFEGLKVFCGYFPFKFILY